jgi:peptide deformylase
MVKILQKDDPILRKVATPVALSDITAPEMKAVIANMQKAMHAEDDAVAIAAPQIGISKRIFVVSGKVFDRFEDKPEGHPDLICINPEIVKLSKDRKQMNEGCLSVRYLYGNVRRASRVSIRAYNEKGELFERGASGLLAQIFQHEIDHLEGILFSDTAKDLKDMPPIKK